jgi:hypothetical protein
LSPFTAFNEHLAILQMTATAAQVLKHGARNVGRNQLINNCVPPINGLLHRQHAHCTAGYSEKLNHDVHFDGVF